MKLTRTTEWALIAALIAYIAFTPGVQAIKDILATPLGKAAALAGIVYVWKFVSPVVALLLIISFLRCARWNVWEMFSGAEVACTCETPDAVWDPQSKTCKDASGNVAGPVKTCTCSNGYAWDGGEAGKKECVPVTSDQPPVPPASNPVADAMAAAAPPAAAGTSMGAAAPAVAGPAAPSVPPMTTPGAAAEMAASPAPPSAMGGVQPGAGATSTAAAV